MRATDATVETTFAVNVLANHVLIGELREHFLPPARIVITTSDTHFGDFKHNMGMVPGPVWREPSELATPGSADKADSARAGRIAYSTSKLAVVYYVHGLARRLPAGVEVFSFNPGLVPGTGLQRDADAISRILFTHPHHAGDDPHPLRPEHDGLRRSDRTPRCRPRRVTR
jgi:NAD(P)-dependent dehydrogenase (short-subunit alcohol dehydrogenase family)